jgi:minimal PKS ketosynthase (KS/KS alpha)
MQRRAVITGVGVVAPGGIGVKDFWDLLSDGRTATRGITFFDASQFRSRVAAEVDFDPEAHGLTPQEIRRMDRAVQFAVVTTAEAMADSGLEPGDLDPYRTGVSIGSAVGATQGLDREYRVVSDGGRLDLVDHRYAVPHLYDYFVPSSFAREVAWKAGAEGPATVVSTGCTSGLDAIGYAVGLIREGSADVMLSGAAAAPISPITVACFDAIKATTPRNDDPEHASRPFDDSRNGFVLGEGAAMFVVEEYERARARGARIYAEIAGSGSTADAHHITAPAPEGEGAVACMEQALFDAQISVVDVAHINAHGTSTPLNDLAEARAINKVFGEPGPPVTSTKGVTGHGLGAAGAIEAVASILAIERKLIPPTYGCEQLDPEIHLDVVRGEARAWEPGPVLSNSFGFGGHNGCLIILPPSE